MPKLPRRLPRPRLRASRFLNASERFSLVTFVVLMLLAFVPAAAVMFYANGQLKSMATTQDRQLLENFRDEQILRLRDQYGLTESQIRAYGAQVTFGGNGQPIAPEETLVPDHVRGTYWFDPAFTFSGVLKSGIDADVEEMSAELSSTAFTSPVVFGSWVSIEGESFQNAFLRLASTTGVVGYVGFVVDSGIVSDPLDSGSPGYSTDVVDDNFDVIYSTDASQVGQHRIDDVTKDMLAGNVATASIDGETVAYGFVDIVESPLYVEVTQVATVNAAKAANALKFMGVIIAVFLIVAFVVTWRYLRSVQRFADGRTAPGYVGRRRMARSAIQSFIEDSDDWDVRLEQMTTDFRRFRKTLTVLRDDMGTTPADAVPHDLDETEPEEDAGRGGRGG